jgi:hypothetical protein
MKIPKDAPICFSMSVLLFPSVFLSASNNLRTVQQISRELGVGKL